MKDAINSLTNVHLSLDSQGLNRGNLNVLDYNMIGHKKAQIGKGIVFLPVLLFIIMILAVYLFAVVGSLIKKPSPINPESIHLVENDILLKNLTIDVNGKETELLVLDAYLLFDKGVIEREKLNEKLKSFVDDGNKCLSIFKKTITEEGRYTYSDEFYFEKYGDIILDTNQFDYSSSDSKNGDFPFNNILYDENNQKYIEYYYGECLK